MDNKINLKDLWTICKEYKFKILFIFIIFNIGGITFFYSVHPKFQAEVLVIDIQAEQFSNRDISVNSSPLLNLGLSNKKEREALMVINSNPFIFYFLIKRNLLKEFYASKSWEPSNNNLQFDGSKLGMLESVYSTQDIFKNPILARSISYKWKKSVNISENIFPGAHEISVTTISPDLSFEMATWIIDDLNEFIRLQDIERSSNLINFLYLKLEQAKIEDEKQILTNLIRKNTELNTQANALNEYVFKIIDPTIKPTSYTFPNLIVFILISSFLSIFISLLFLFLKYLLRVDQF